MKTALITGASSGIGRDIARNLHHDGYKLILVGRNLNRLNELKEEFNNDDIVISCDLSIENNCYELYQKVKDYNISLLINNAGFGAFGFFDEIDYKIEKKMVLTNDLAPHLLMKIFLKDFMTNNEGKIVNICSSASFYPGPLMATYYASKSYLYRLSLALQEELRRKKSKVKILIVCPGPVKTNFQDVADVRFVLGAVTSEYIARKTCQAIRKNKKILIPTFTMKCGKFFSHFCSDRFLAKIAYNFQRRKQSD